MFKLKFPSGATLEFSQGHSLAPRYDGTLYIWPEDLEPLLDVVLKEKENDSTMSRTAEFDRDKDSGVRQSER